MCFLLLSTGINNAAKLPIYGENTLDISIVDSTKTLKNKVSLIVDLKYYEGTPVIREIKRISKPGRRVYSSATSIPRIQNGLGLAIISTNKGIMSDIEARKNNVGGEIICRVF